jgi:hypothetical protein
MSGLIAESLKDQIITQAVGPLVTVVFGGFVLSFIARQYQIRDADQKLRESLAHDVASIGGLFYSLIGAAMRAQDTHDPKLIRVTTKALEANFEKFIVDSGVLEKRLSAYSESCSLNWHATNDCATVLFYDLAGYPETTMDRIFRINAKDFDNKKHSGLSEEDLHNRHEVMDQFARQMHNITSETLKKSKNTKG